MSGIAVLVLAAGSADAALLSRAGGEAVYDTALNITWLADANYARTSGFADAGPDGRMPWGTARSWIDSLNAESGGVGHLGVNDWRLPQTAQPDAGCSNQEPGKSSGTGCSGSEMGHLYYLDGVTAAAPGLFSNVQLVYWSDTSYAPNAQNAWAFGFSNGVQDIGWKVLTLSAWAVRDGDIDDAGAVPAPGALWLLGTGIVALAAKLKRRVRDAGVAA